MDRRTVEQLATCDFVRRRENVILVGQTGLGKSRILQAIGRAACVLGYRVRYVTSAKLIQELTAALADGSFTRTLNAYARLELLLIDEFGFDRLEREAHAQASTVYDRLLDARTGRRSTALATNIDFKAWGDYLGDPPLATAFLDRLVDGAVILKLTGRSYRAIALGPSSEPMGSIEIDRPVGTTLALTSRFPPHIPSHPPDLQTEQGSPYRFHGGQSHHAATAQVVPTGLPKWCPLRL